MPGSLDRARLEAIVEAAADRLAGDWLIVGGAAVALWLDDTRTTMDVDFVSFDDAASPLPLYELASELGHPIEAFNPAASYFIRRIAGWRDHVVMLRTGATGRIFRPDGTLLVLSKLGRLSEQDLADCLAAVRAESDLDRQAIQVSLDAASATVVAGGLGTDERTKRLRTLGLALQTGASRS